jgi:energy-coupling factor transporter ATP-binding protein EcfA2
VTDRTDAEAVLIIGAYGTGKSSMVEELASILEEREVRFGALDLDWLGWFDPGFGSGEHAAGWPVKLKNIDAVVGNYYDTGVRRFALAGSVESTGQVADLRGALGMSFTTVRLTLPIEEIELRLSTAVTTGRQDDVLVARAQIAEGRGEGIEDLVFENDRQIRTTALEVLSVLGW